MPACALASCGCGSECRTPAFALAKTELPLQNRPKVVSAEMPNFRIAGVTLGTLSRPPQLLVGTRLRFEKTTAQDPEVHGTVGVH